MMAQSVADGARSVAGADVSLLEVDRIDDAGWTSLRQADAIVFGSPTYMGSVSGPFKVFADATAKIWLTQGWKDKVAGGFTCSLSMSGDKLSTLQYLVVLAMQHSMIWVGTGMLPASEPGDPDAMNRLGSGIGPMGQAGNVPADVEPPDGDLETCHAYGQRIAQMAARHAVAT